MRKYVFIAIVTLLLTSCQEVPFYERNSAIPKQLWDSSYKPQFQVEVENKEDRFDLFFNIRHTAYYPYSNFSFYIEQKQLQQDSIIRSEIKLAESDGRWLGNSAGNLYGQTVLLRENFTFPDTGKYVFSVGQAMRENPLRGINDVGIKIIKR